MRKRLEATVLGHVQGVSFRYYTLREARHLGLTGWVANRMDGTVVVVAEGEEQLIDKLIVFLRRGSPKARVHDLKLNHFPASNEFKDFTVRYI